MICINGSFLSVSTGFEIPIHSLVKYKPELLKTKNQLPLFKLIGITYLLEHDGHMALDRSPEFWTVFPLTFQLGGFVHLTSEKWGYKKQNRGTKITASIIPKRNYFLKFRNSKT